MLKSAGIDVCILLQLCEHLAVLIEWLRPNSDADLVLQTTAVFIQDILAESDSSGSTK